MGYWATHTFVRTTDMTILEQAVQQVLALDEYEPIAKPTPEVSFERKTSQYGEQIYLRKEFCGVLLIPMTSRDQKWSYIYSAPPSLFCERAKGADHPRLAELAKILQADAFHLEVEDGDSAVLLECKANGEFRVCGSLTSMLEEAYSDYTGELDEEIEEPPVKFFEEESQSHETTFEILSDLKSFSPDNFSYPEPAAYAIEAEFFGSVGVNRYLNRLFDGNPVDFTDAAVRESYFYKRVLWV
jgi:hypothetical protein